MKYLLYIQGKSERSIDECLMVVPENFDRKLVLETAEDAGISGAYIANKIEIMVGAFGDVASDYRPYIG